MIISLNYESSYLNLLPSFIMGFSSCGNFLDTGGPRTQKQKGSQQACCNPFIELVRRSESNRIYIFIFTIDIQNTIILPVNSGHNPAFGRKDDYSRWPEAYRLIFSLPAPYVVLLPYPCQVKSVIPCL